MYTCLYMCVCVCVCVYVCVYRVNLIPRLKHTSSQFNKYNDTLFRALEILTMAPREYSSGLTRIFLFEAPTAAYGGRLLLSGCAKRIYRYR